MSEPKNWVPLNLGPLVFKTMADPLGYSPLSNILKCDALASTLSFNEDLGKPAPSLC